MAHLEINLERKESATVNPETNDNENKESKPTKPTKLGKGRKYCTQCKKIIGARCAICKYCKYVYPFKGKAKTKRSLGLEHVYQNYKHANFSTNGNNEDDENNPYKQHHSSFMKNKPNFVDIEPKQKQQMTTEVIDSYINESQLLLNSAFEQISKFGDLESAAKILNRSLINLTYLSTLCDSNDHHPDKCPDLNHFI
eukprot:UN06837